MPYSIIAARLRAERRARRDIVTPSVAPRVRLTTGTDYAHQGHRLDIPDERLISHREPRWIGGRRYVWRDETWCLSPDLHRTSDPQPKPVNPVRDARRTHPEHHEAKLLNLVDAIVEAGGRPEDAVLIVGRRLK